MFGSNNIKDTAPLSHCHSWLNLLVTESETANTLLYNIMVPKSEQKEETLNSAQSQAVSFKGGPVLVVAGAGTGKTKVLVERIIKLIDEGTPPKRILALTFTEKAASEMQDRVNNALGGIHADLLLMTFNAFGESLLRKYASDIGMSRNFRLIGENAQVVFLRERLDLLGLDYFAPVSSPEGQLTNLSSYFSKLKQYVITPRQYQEFADNMGENDPADKLDKIKHQELASAYAAYINLMKEASVIDYDDQIYLTIELLKSRPNVLKDVQNQFDEVMVDEFQDTNTMQSVLVDMLVERTQKLFAVGDDDQSIYGWRGATLANILDFKNRYPRAKDITLVENYRSTKEILDSAYKLIKNNNPHRLEEKLKINKQLVGQKSGHRPTINSFESIDEEMRWVAGDIKMRIAAGANPGDIAILSRRNTTIERVHTQLELDEIEHTVIGQRFELYKEPIVRSLIESLKALVDPLDSTSLYHTLTGPFFNMPVHPLNDIAAQARRTHQKLADAIEASDDNDLKSTLERIKKWSSLAAGINVGQLAYHVIEDSGYVDKLKAEADVMGTIGLRLTDYFQTLREFEGIAVVPSALQYVESLPALQAAGESLEDGTLDLSASSVNVLSVHKSKGLEWPLVYIVDCTEGSFPLVSRPSGIGLPEGLATAHETEADEHIREERRLMYVAMTRAKDTLVLTYSARHSTASTRKPSRFIAEAFTETDIVSIASDGNAYVPVLPKNSPLKERAVALPKTLLHDDHVELTVSQVKNYLDCPLDFYYKYVLSMPQEPGFTQTYGTIMHSLLEELNQCVLDGKKINHPALEPGLIANWPQFGHASSAQRDRALEHAKKVFKRLCSDMATNPRRPLAIEESFKITLPELALTVRGRFDAVFPLGEGVEIVDYKTSTSVDTPEKAKQRASSSEQLTLYALAWHRMHDELPALVTLDFIDTGERGSLKKTIRGIDGAVSRLQKVAEGIRSNQFPPGKEHRFCIHPEAIK